MALTFALQKKMLRKKCHGLLPYIKFPPPSSSVLAKKGGKKLGQNLIRKRKLADQKSVALTVEICWRRCF